MRTLFSVLSATLIFVATESAAQASAPLSGAARWADSARVLLHRAVIAGNPARIAVARGVADRALQAFPNDPLLLYYKGEALWREAQLRRAQGHEEEATVLFNGAIEALQLSLRGRQLPEAQAIIASANGNLAAGGMTAGIRYGPRANAAEEAALALDANNPRVQLVIAIASYYKPAAFGGGKEKARAALMRAIAGFERPAPAAPLPSWGAAEAYAWLGQFEAAEGRTAEARAAYERALALEPEYAWVKFGLLPALERGR